MKVLRLSLGGDVATARSASKYCNEGKGSAGCHANAAQQSTSHLWWHSSQVSSNFLAGTTRHALRFLFCRRDWSAEPEKRSSPGHLSFKRGGPKPRPLRKAKGSPRGAHLRLLQLGSFGSAVTHGRPGPGKLKARGAARVRGPDLGRRGLRNGPEAALRSAVSLEGQCHSYCRAERGEAPQALPQGREFGWAAKPSEGPSCCPGIPGPQDLDPALAPDPALALPSLGL